MLSLEGEPLAFRLLLNLRLVLWINFFPLLLASLVSLSLLEFNCEFLGESLLSLPVVMLFRFFFKCMVLPLLACLEYFDVCGC